MIFPPYFPSLPFNKFDLAALNSYTAVLKDEGILINVDLVMAAQGLALLNVKPPAHLNASAVSMGIFKVGSKGIFFNSARWVVSYGFAVPNFREVADEDVIKSLGCSARLSQLKAIEQAMHDVFFNNPNGVAFEDAIVQALSL